MENTNKIVKIEFLAKDNLTELNNVIELGNKNSKTLGLLPSSAYQDFVKTKQIIIAKNIDNTIVGYIAFRKVKTRNSITIVQFCVDTNFRGLNISDKLFEFLRQEHSLHNYISLSCREEYVEAIALWKRLGFTKEHTKPGRSKKGTVLFVWVFKLKQDNFIWDINEDSRKIVVLDLNVIIDIWEKSKENQLHFLTADWLQNEVIFKVTRQIKNEECISKELDDFIKENFDFLDSCDLKLPELKAHLRNKYYSNFRSDIDNDLTHLAVAINSNIPYFVSNDKKHLLKRKNEIENEFGIKIYSPEQLISEIDSLINENEYKPSLITGTDIVVRRLQANEFDEIINLFLKFENNEKKYELENLLNDSLKNIDKSESLLIKFESNYVALGVFYFNQQNLEIPILRITKNKEYKTYFKHCLYYFIKSSFDNENNNISKIEISEKQIDEHLQNILKELRFQNKNNVWLKTILKGIYNLKELIEFDTDFANFEPIELERVYYPAKIIDIEIPTFIVPIRPYWAQKLFATSYAEYDIFKDKTELLLNRENIYYRSSNSSNITGKCRVLWYVSSSSSSKSHLGKELLGCSYVDRGFIENKKFLFKKYKDLGIYSWDEINSINKKSNRPINAFIFSDTELFLQPIKYDKVKELMDYEFQGKHNNLVSPVKISNSLFIQLYKLGFKYE